ncbi:thioredoxin domain-containing protein [Fibrella aquatilis]|uniref:Thioredoxin fold domain-containing protein n=1 Tax=Fibrella aquatilis TaxID=2817059 RepID=A0A939G583_9BACT|nr:thioredoxin domain-containing protein [Fibrella aquatilis]MBO0932607.1 thioredoxin fold domain-containing protein [Fibrella aquatilis]
MKSIIITTLLLFLFLVKGISGCILSDSSRVKLFKGSWEHLINNATKTNKPILIDFYTSWCGPCKYMDKEAFNDSAIATRLNNTFIIYKLDAEKGIGIKLAKLYNVHAYPTLVFANPKGGIAYRSIGYEGVARLNEAISIGLKSLDDPKPLAVWENEYSKNRYSRKFLKEFISKKSELGLNCRKEITDYCKLFTYPELTDNSNVSTLLMGVQSPNELPFKIIFNKLISKDSTSIIDKPKAISILEQAIINDYDDAIESKSVVKLHHHLSIHENFYKKIYKFSTLMIESQKTTKSMNFYLKTRNFKGYKPLAELYAGKLMKISDDSLKIGDEREYKNILKYFSTFPDSIKLYKINNLSSRARRISSNFLTSDLQEVSQSFSEMSTSKNDYEKAIVWMQRSVSITQNSGCFHLLAGLYYKNGNKKLAIESQEKAIDFAQQEDVDVQDLLIELDAMKAGKANFLKTAK